MFFCCQKQECFLCLRVVESIGNQGDRSAVFSALSNVRIVISLCQVIIGALVFIKVLCAEWGVWITVLDRTARRLARSGCPMGRMSNVTRTYSPLVDVLSLQVIEMFDCLCLAKNPVATDLCLIMEYRP